MENNRQTGQNLNRCRRAVSTLQRQVDALQPQLIQIQDSTGTSVEEVRRQAELCRKSLQTLAELMESLESRSSLSREMKMFPTLYGPPSVFKKDL